MDLIIRILILLAVLLPLSVRSQSGEARYRFSHLTVNEGLSHSDAMCVVQDKAGFIWVGTNNGINRYDGYGLKTYLLPVNQHNGLSGNRIHAAHVDTQGNLWVGSEGAGISRYNAVRDLFENMGDLPLPNASAKSLLHRSNVQKIVSTPGRIWVGTRENGLFVLRLNKAGQVVEIIPVSHPQNKAQRIHDLAVSSDGTVWIAADTDGLYKVTKASPTELVSTSLRSSVVAVYVDKKEQLWVGTEEQIYWVEHPHTETVLDRHALPRSYKGLRIECLLVDSYGQLWVGSNHGLDVWAKATPKPESPYGLAPTPTTYIPLDEEPFSINSGRIHELYEDRYQVMWLAASAGGLNKVDLQRKPFSWLHRQASQQPTLPNNYINAIFKDEAENALWIGTRNGFSRYDLKTKTYRNFLNRPLPGDATGIDVSSLFKDSKGTLWVGTRSRGVLRMKGGQLTPVSAFEPGQVAYQTSAEHIIEDSFHTIWVATFESGLFRFDQAGNLLEHYHLGSNAPLPTNHFTFLLFDAATRVLWASTKDSGVLKFSITNDSLQFLKRFSYEPGNVNSLSVNYAWPLLNDHHGTLWIGTIGGGLNKLYTNAKGQEVIERYNRYLPQTNIESILEDEKGQLWMGGEGLIRFDPETKQRINYDIADGLQSNSFKVNAACPSTDGTLFFGGIKGITYFKPNEIKHNPYPSLIHLTGLRIFNKPVGVGEEVNGRVVLTQTLDQTNHLLIKSAENDFSIEFVALNYANPQKHTYAYRLIGYSDEWITAGPGQRVASFAGLPAGDYTFEVKADNGEGYWSAEPAILNLTVLPPWWRSWWAILGYGMLVLGALVLYRRFTLAQQALKNTLALEKFKTEKEKEITDVKLRFFTNVSHELRTPLTLILGPMEELMAAVQTPLQSKVKLMHTQAHKLLDLVNQLLDFRKIESEHIPLKITYGNITALIRDVYQQFKLKAEDTDIDYTIELPTEDISMHFDRQRIEVILTNLLSNAFKYTKNHGKIRTSVRAVGSTDGPAVYEGGQLRHHYLSIEVEDWGTGMNPQELDKIFNAYYQASHTESLGIQGTGLGLALTKAFVLAHGGEITVESQSGSGTKFTVRLPFGPHSLPYATIDNPSEMVLSAEESVELVSTERQEGKILIVEDNADVRQYLNELFSQTHEVMLAVDGLDGWFKTISWNPDLIISDVMMPNSDGLELCKKLKQHPKTLHIPVILLTARTAAVHELEGLELGAEEYMAKPFSPKLLYTKVTGLLKSRQTLREYYQRQILLEPTEIQIPDEERMFLTRATQIVEANLENQEFNVPTFVREMNMSQSAFYRQIKSITGQSVVEFIRDVRLKRAAQLLSTSHLRVTEVASMVGMEDMKYFRKTFQQLYGMPPSEYARQHYQPE